MSIFNDNRGPTRNIISANNCCPRQLHCTRLQSPKITLFHVTRQTMSQCNANVNRAANHAALSTHWLTADAETAVDLISVCF